MSVRRTFLMLIPPLFLLLAGVNGALLYFWEKAEAERGLERQAIAAAVTVAAFADAHDDLGRALSDPVRAAALRSAGARVVGLHGLYIVTPDGEVLQIAGAPSAYWPGSFEAPKAPRAAPVRSDPTGQHMATGLAPVAGGGYVIAQIDAGPLFAQVAELRRLVVGLVIGAGLVGLLLALVIARGIVRELRGVSGMIEAIRTDAPPGEAGAFRIRETRDLALAVRLMRTSVSGRLARGRHELARRDRERDEAAAAAAYHASAFPPLATEAAGAAVAVRMLGRAPVGGFYALCVAGDRAGLVLGQCAGETPAAALAQALAARAHFEARLLDGAFDERVDDGRRAYDIGWCVGRAWSSTHPPTTGALTLLDGDNTRRAEAYAARAAGLTPGQVLDDLAALLEANGIAAVIGSAQRGEG